MKKITYSVFLLVCAIGFSQQPMVNTLGENNPVRFDKQQKSAVHSNGILDNSSKSILLLGDNNPVTHQRSAVTLPVNQQDIQAEIAADLLYRSENPEVISSVVRNANRPMDDIIPTAGATESFTPNVGDHFFDPGGPGGSNSDGDAGNYPNCNCDTQTTLLGVTEIEFIDFMVFATFDYLRIYDGTDATGTLIYDNGDGGMNEDDQNLNDMIASNGSATFTSTSGNFFFFFHASSVVNRLGWDVEIIAAGGGGGGTFPDPYCGPVDFSSTIEPITKVTFAGIENSSSDSTSSPAHEDFTDVEGNVEQGESYDIALEGNTNGSWTNNFTVFIDWNQNGSMDDAGERYEAGTINSSTGLDGQQAITNIAVPADAALGSTRMRVIKNFGATSFAPDSCTGSNWGQAEDYTIVVSAGSDGGGGSGDVCSQGTESNNIENGWGNVSLLTYANDFVVAQNEEFTLEQFSVNFLLNPGQPIVSADIYFYEDTGGNGPGAEIPGTSSLGVVPDSQQAVGSHPAGFDLIQGVWTLATPITFEGNASGETVYWMGIQIEYAGANAFMETSSVYDTPNEAYFTDDGGATWTSGLANFGADMHGVVTFSGQCEIVDDGGGDVVYCTPMLDCTDGDMITNVTFQEINNTTTCSPNGYGDYTDMVAVVEAGETYSISVSVGDGWSSESVSVWIDFDNNGSFDEDEFYFIGTGSGEALLGDIAIPADAANGDYRMRVRVVADGADSATWDMSCDEDQFFGETEDYTIEVVEGSGGIDYCTPEGINSARYINNFATTGGSENISNMGSGFSTGGYGDFTSMKVKQVQTNEVDFTVGIEGGTAGFRVWVDWNQDGVFDTTEEVAYQSSSYSSSHTGSFMIPEDAMPGETRMRIVSHWLSSSGTIDPCATGFDYGESEDYTLEVVALEACSEAIAGTVVRSEERRVGKECRSGWSPNN